MSNLDYKAMYIKERIDLNEISEQSADVARKMFYSVAKAEDALGIRIEDNLTKSDFKKIFETIGISKVHYFQNLKIWLTGYLEWLEENGYASPDIKALSRLKYEEFDKSAAFDRWYFKDFQSLQDRIEEAVWSTDKIDDMVFATKITAIYLAWCGVKVNEAVEIKKSDVLDDGIIVGDRIIRPNATIMNYIKTYCDAEGYSMQGKGVIFANYAPSIYLLRTIRSPQLTAKLLSYSLTKFCNPDRESHQEHISFMYSNIYWSGVFSRAYLYEIENGAVKRGDVETISRLFGEQYSCTAEANLRLRNYQGYKEHFFPVHK